MKNALLQKLVDRMKSDKKFEIGVYVVLVLAIVLLYALSSGNQGSAGKKGSGNDGQEGIAKASATSYESERELEERLQSALASIRGAGKVEVMITYETGPEIVPAMNVDTQSSSSQGDSSNTVSETQSQKPATVNQGSANEPIVLTEIKPTIRGVIVIAEGASDIRVSVDLQRAVQTVLGISVDSIEVFEMSVKEDILK